MHSLILEREENTIFLIYAVGGTLYVLELQSSRNRFSARSCLAHDVCYLSRAPINSPTVQLVVWNIRGLRRESVHCIIFIIKKIENYA